MSHLFTFWLYGHANLILDANSALYSILRQVGFFRVLAVDI